MQTESRRRDCKRDHKANQVPRERARPATTGQALSRASPQQILRLLAQRTGANSDLTARHHAEILTQRGVVVDVTHAPDAEELQPFGELLGAAQAALVPNH